MGQYKVCVYAICKNEVQFVERWMESMKEADLVVVTDTGSTDGTVEKLRECGAVVHVEEIKPWRFDVARNVSLEHVPEDIDICVCTDLDEILLPGWREKLEDAWSEDIVQGRYLYNWALNPDGTPNVQFTYFKVHTRQGFEWVYPIHEVIRYVGKDKPHNEVFIEGMVLNHYPDHSKSRGSYLTLLEVAVKENPEDDRMVYYLGREYMYVAQWDNCIETLKNHLNLKSATWPDERCASMRWIAASFQALGKIQEAYNWYYRAIAELPMMREPYIECARLANQQKDWSIAFYMAEAALKIKNKSQTYVNMGYAWDYTPNDIAGISSFYLGMYDNALYHAKEALTFAPNDERLQNNLNFAQHAVNSENEKKKNKVKAPVLPEEKPKVLLTKEESPKTAIIILTYNNLEYNKACLDSVRKYSEEGTYELVIIDNCSSDGTREWLETQKDIKLQLNDENVGFVKGCNQGIALAEPDSDILLLNNDTVVTPRWLENLKTCLYSEESIGAVGAVCNQFANAQGLETTYGDNLEEMIVFADKNNVSDSTRWEQKNFLIGFCKLIKREVFNKIGALDERYSPGYVEDNDLSISIINEGYKLILCHDVYIHHYLGTSFRKDWDKFWRLVLGNREKFNEKWGFHTDRFEDIRNDLVQLIDEADHKKAIRVLDINCSIGGTLLKVKKNYPNASLYGIDDREDMNKITKQFIHLSEKKVGEFPLDFEEASFDYIIIGNYLDEVKHADVFLTNIRKYLKEGGKLIAGISNPLHVSRVKPYLNGELVKQDNGSKYPFLNIADALVSFSKAGYTAPYMYHWYTTLNEEEESLVKKLIEITGKEKETLYRTNLVAIRIQKSMD